MIPGERSLMTLLQATRAAALLLAAPGCTQRHRPRRRRSGRRGSPHRPRRNAADYRYPDARAAWASAAGARQIAILYIPEGPLPALNQAIWPHATAGSFKVKERIPQILHEAGIR